MKIATLDVGGSAIKYCLMDNDAMTCQGSVPTPDTSSTDPEPFLAAVGGILEQVGGTDQLDGVAFSMPGIIEVDEKIIRLGGALRYNYGADVKEWEKRFGLPMEVENDAKCSAMAEFAAGNLRGVRNGVVLAFGTGIGGGAVVNGEIHKGSHLYAGEASMMYSRMPNRHSAVPDDGSWATDCSTHGLCRRVALAKGIERCTGREVCAWVEQGDEVAARVFRDVCDGIALQIHNIQCWIDPERICLGGGISKSELFIEEVRAAHKRFNAELAYDFPEVEIVACRFFNDANLIGAYQHFLHMRKKRAAA